MEQQYDQFIDSLKCHKIAIAGIKTAVYSHNAGHKRTFLLVHGGGGDFHGMIPLAYHLKNAANIVLVDLPSHGDSELVTDINLRRMQQWAKAALPALKKRGFRVDTVVAHSFGCVVARYMGCPQTWYINPPLKTPIYIKLTSVVTYWLRSLVKLGYLNHKFAVARGVWMLHHKTPKNRSLVEWLTYRTKANQAQTVAYIKLAKEVAIGYELVLPAAKLVGVVNSTYDTVVKPIQKSSVQCNIFTEVDAGHLSVLEQPAEIARAILAP